LCLIPPQDIWGPIDRFRALNDKGYGKWPPHINLIYPFVPPNSLDQVADLLSRLNYSDTLPFRLSLTEVDSFDRKHDSTIYIRPDHASDGHVLRVLNKRLHNALGRTERKPYQPHMTVAQSYDSNSDAHDFLLDKARLLTPFTWEAADIAILVRDRQKHGEDISSSMRLWGTISTITGTVTREFSHDGFYQYSLGRENQPVGPLMRPQSAFTYSATTNSWEHLSNPERDTVSVQGRSEPVDRLIVASYNVLAEFEWPPASTRHAHLVRNICMGRAQADILVLQEVTDSFLENLLGNPAVCEQYPFATHGRPSEKGAGPLPNLLNVVVLSKFPMEWEYLEHARKHKGSAVVSFPTLRVRRADGDESLPLVLAACHLSQGLTDGAVAAKKQEVQDLLKQLRSAYAEQPWLLVGDFNLTTSSFTIGMARKKGVLSSHALQQLRDIDGLLFDNGFRDVWLDTRLASGESSGGHAAQGNLGQLHEGEQGATFDPQNNTLAAKESGFGLNTRPQRYDRIFVSDHLGLHPMGFNMFGQDTAKSSEDRMAQHASDHWGIRCLLQAQANKSTLGSESAPKKPVELQRAPESLGGLEDLTTCLSKRGLIPTSEDEALRMQAIALLRRVLIDEMTNQGEADSHFKPVLVLIPVGSTALGVWTPSSDVDCLCVGGISSKTFFALALKRLRKATAEGITILRKVRANSGTMLELVVQGIRFDLQYCPSISIAEQSVASWCIIASVLTVL
jgi:2'-5' RNA ligase/endonuclease/exonuclease/phosphatase family metal-dependent hydrolase